MLASLVMMFLSSAAALQIAAKAPQLRVTTARMASFDDAVSNLDNVGGDINSRIEQLVTDNKVMLFMKGNKM